MVMRRTESIRLRVSDAEYEIIKENARKHGKKVVPYIRDVAQNPTIINQEYSAVKEHTRLVKDRVKSVNQLIFTISVVGDYIPKEIEGIRDYVIEILETENKLLRTVRNQWIKAYKKNRA
jgi:predicted hydrolase (HD superfamily)